MTLGGEGRLKGDVERGEVSEVCEGRVEEEGVTDRLEVTIGSARFVCDVCWQRDEAAVCGRRMQHCSCAGARGSGSELRAGRRSSEAGGTRSGTPLQSSTPSLTVVSCVDSFGWEPGVRGLGNDCMCGCLGLYRGCGSNAGFAGTQLGLH